MANLNGKGRFMIRKRTAPILPKKFNTDSTKPPNADTQVQKETLSNIVKSCVPDSSNLSNELTKMYDELHQQEDTEKTTQPCISEPTNLNDTTKLIENCNDSELPLLAKLEMCVKVDEVSPHHNNVVSNSFSTEPKTNNVDEEIGLKEQKMDSSYPLLDSSKTEIVNDPQIKHVDGGIGLKEKRMEISHPLLDSSQTKVVNVPKINQVDEEIGLEEKKMETADPLLDSSETKIVNDPKTNHVDEEIRLQEKEVETSDPLIDSSETKIINNPGKKEHPIKTLSKFSRRRFGPKLVCKTSVMTSSKNNNIEKILSENKTVEQVQDSNKVEDKCLDDFNISKNSCLDEININQTVISDESGGSEKANSINIIANIACPEEHPEPEGVVRVYLNCWPQYPLDDLKDDPFFENRNVKELGKVSVFMSKGHNVAYCDMKSPVDFLQIPKNWAYVNFNKLIKEEFKEPEIEEDEKLIEYQPYEFTEDNLQSYQNCSSQETFNYISYEDQLIDYSTKKFTLPQYKNWGEVSGYRCYPADSYYQTDLPLDLSVKRKENDQINSTTYDDNTCDDGISVDILNEIDSSERDVESLKRDSKQLSTDIVVKCKKPYGLRKFKLPIKFREEVDKDAGVPKDIFPNSEATNIVKCKKPYGLRKFKPPIKFREEDKDANVSSNSEGTDIVKCKKPYGLRKSKLPVKYREEVDKDTDIPEDIFSNSEDSDVSEYDGEDQLKKIHLITQKTKSSPVGSERKKKRRTVKVRRKNVTKNSCKKINNSKKINRKAVKKERKTVKVEDGTNPEHDKINKKEKPPKSLENASPFFKLGMEVKNKNKWDKDGICSEPEKLELKDFIFYVPKNEPMTQDKKELNLDDKEIEPAEEEAVKGEVEEEEEEEGGEEETHGPKLIVKDGKIIVDPNSTKIKQTPLMMPIKTEKWEKPREANEQWELRETMKFYATLWKYGIDFSMLAVSFPEKKRLSLKRKFSYEEKYNGDLLKRTLTKQLDLKSVLREVILIDALIKYHSKKKKKSETPIKEDEEAGTKPLKYCLLQKPKRKRRSSNRENNNSDKKLRTNSISIEDDDDNSCHSQTKTWLSDEIIISDDINSLNMKDIITFSTNVIYKDLNVVESVSFHPSSEQPVDINVTICHEPNNSDDTAIK